MRNARWREQLKIVTLVRVFSKALRHMTTVVDAQRIRKLNGAKPADGKLVIYWMSRDQVHGGWRQ